MIVQKTKKGKKGLSGAITALILVIASVIIALVVVFFAFGYLGAFSSSPTVTQVGTAKIIECTTSGSGTTTSYKLCVTLSSNTQTKIVAVEVGSHSISPAQCTIIYAGTNLYHIPLPSITYAAGQTYTVDLVLSGGQVVVVSAIAC
ncbi:hypothetical protein D1867_07865 [Acidianus infernus]|uniref:DUF973 family protein n=1 Tax=Acidianus infernus TaxID=12915 RepID=A0A6A9QEA8_ACIIN|nr:hypothetical protein [Acidianus infernus]MUM65149.1 hypothetical protein [Acidianus infernus]